MFSQLYFDAWVKIDILESILLILLIFTSSQIEWYEILPQLDGQDRLAVLVGEDLLKWVVGS
jgi:hypothetical protein